MGLVKWDERGVGRLVRLVRPDSPWLALGGATMLVSALTTSAYAWLAGPVASLVYGGSPAWLHRLPAWAATLASDRARLVVWVGVALVVVSGVRGVAGYLQRISMATVGQNAVRSLRVALYEHVLSLVPGALLAEKRGELASRVSGDVLQVQVLINIGVATLCSDIVTIGVVGTLAFRLSWQMTLVALSALPIIAALVFVAAKRTREAYRKTWEQHGKVAGAVAESAALVPLVRTYGIVDRVVLRFRELSDELRRRSLVATKVGALTTPLMETLGGVGVAAALWWGSQRVSSHALAPETFVSFFACMALFYRPVQGLGQTAQQVATGLAALDRVQELVDMAREAPDATDAVTLPPLAKSIRIEGLRVQLGEKEVLKGLDLEIRKGESLAIVGPSGEGKTTLLRALLRLVEPSAGRILVDGVDVMTATRASVRAQMAWVSQEPLLYADTIAANVTLEPSLSPSVGSESSPSRSSPSSPTAPPPPSEKLRTALADADALDFVEGLPEGVDTELAEAGLTLSAGQRQRLAIARALYRNAPVLLLDEPTAALDGHAEREVSAALERLLGEHTSVIVSHRWSTVRRAQRVAVLEDGRVVEEGAPDVLLRRGGALAKLFAVEVGGAVEGSGVRAVEAS